MHYSSLASVTQTVVKNSYEFVLHVPSQHDFRFRRSETTSTATHGCGTCTHNDTHIHAPQSHDDTRTRHTHVPLCLTFQQLKSRDSVGLSLQGVLRFQRQNGRVTLAPGL